MVQISTEITDNTYREFRELARERELSLETVVRDAIDDWIEQQQQVHPNDPLFTLVADAARDSMSETLRTNASTEDDLVDEWSGNTADITLADPSE